MGRHDMSHCYGEVYDKYAARALVCFASRHEYTVNGVHSRPGSAESSHIEGLIQPEAGEGDGAHAPHMLCISINALTCWLGASEACRAAWFLIL